MTKPTFLNKTQITTWSLCILLTATLGSCSLNDAFLNPEYKFEHKVNALKKVDKTYEVNVILDSNNNPTFVNDSNRVLTLDYDVKMVRFKSTSNNLLHGWEITPKYNYNGSTILFCHGNAGDVIANHYAAIPLVKRGFKVFIFDYSGFGLSEGKATRANVKKDGLAALDYVLENKDTILTKKVFVYGQSLGGHLAPVIAVKRENEIHGLIIEGAFSSHKDISHHYSGYKGRLFTAEKYSGKKAIKQFHKPVLIIHSTEDTRVPYFMGETLYANANEPKKLLKIKNCHVCGIIYYPNEIVKMILEM